MINIMTFQQLQHKLSKLREIKQQVKALQEGIPTDAKYSDNDDFNFLRSTDAIISEINYAFSRSYDCETLQQCQ